MNFAILAVYLLGSIPFGYLAGRMRGVDVRQHGSGNIGATNVLRTLGKGPGIVVFALDVLKGLTAVYLVVLLGPGGLAEDTAKVLAGLAAILGHNYTFWLGFKGGKGIATSAGVFLGLAPLATLVIVGVWALLFFVTRYVSVASIGAALVLPPAVIFLHRTTPGPALITFSALAAALAVWRHRSNIRRLRDGTEPRHTRKSKQS